MKARFLITCNELPTTAVNEEISNLKLDEGLEIVGRGKRGGKFRGVDYIAVAQIAAPALSAFAALLACLAKRRESGYVKIDHPGLHLEIRSDMGGKQMADLVKQLEAYLHHQCQSGSNAELQVTL